MSTAVTAPAPPDSRRWRALGAIAVGQFMIAVDATIMNISLPSAQRALHLSDSGAQWVITVFALCYGGLLLLGGRLSDLIGRRNCLLIGLAGFAAASILGGAAVNPAMLLLSRALQGVFGALFTPSALALLGTTFTTPAERGKAFGIYGTVMGSSSGIGLMLGGVLTDTLGWRWSMYVSVPIAVAAAAGIAHAVRPAPRLAGTRVDVAGAVLATSGFMALVFGLTRAGADGWSAPLTLGCLAAGVALLALFVLLESRVAQPLLPLRVVLDRSRGSAYLAVLCMAVGNFAAFFFLTFFMQTVLKLSPLVTGLAFLPYTAAIMLAVRLARRLLERAPVRLLLCSGLLSTALALALFGLLRLDSGYAFPLLPILVLLGAGNGWVLVPANGTATLNAGPDTAVAGATVMTSMQIGASLGIALLGTAAGTATAAFLGSHPAATDLAGRATVHGYGVAGMAGAAFLCLAALTVFLVAGPKGSAGR
ncbi:MFS transporter [Streptosporangium sp. NBC_01639]|uniref:MFS transporter n=1 Tax=Streptosporangium sp. NBC_01639 TaxID=2975948 RepID=UPI003869020B|nr:MFS transporter [Streptosporangium sp. NBC_01639]